MATAFFKLEKSGELSHDEAHAAVRGAHQVVRIDIRQGKTAIYFAADTGDTHSADLRKASTEVKRIDVTSF